MLGPNRRSHLPLSRRNVLTIGGAGMLGLTVPRLLHAAERPSTIAPRAKSVILIFNCGAPSQHDLWDMKPQAASEIRGEFQPISTNVAGIQISELLPQLAKRTDKLAIVRTVHHQHGGHNAGMYWSIVGRPYRIVATAELPIAQLQKLIRWLALGSYRASAVTVRTRPVPPGSRCIPSHELTVTFNAPKTESVALGRPVLWDLGDGKAEVIVRRVDRLDGAPLAIGASPSRRLRELRAQAKAELALGKKLGRPLGPIYAEAMQRAMDLQTRGHARPSEIPTFFDDLRVEVGGLPIELLDR